MQGYMYLRTRELSEAYMCSGTYGVRFPLKLRK